MHCRPMISPLSSRFLFFFPLQPNSFKGIYYIHCSPSFPSFKSMLLSLHTTPTKLPLMKDNLTTAHLLNRVMVSHSVALSRPLQVLSSPVLKDTVLHGFPRSSQSPAASSCQLPSMREFSAGSLNLFPCSLRNLSQPHGL